MSENKWEKRNNVKKKKFIIAREEHADYVIVEHYKKLRYKLSQYKHRDVPLKSQDIKLIQFLTRAAKYIFRYFSLFIYGLKFRNHYFNVTLERFHVRYEKKYSDVFIIIK